MRYQNLNDCVPKRYWLHGRCWIGRFALEWALPGDFSFGFGINGGDCNDQLHGSICLGLFSLYWHMNFFRFRVGHWSEFYKDKFFIHEEREFRISIHGGAIWLSPWLEPMGEWHKGISWWKAIHCFNPMDFIFGCMKYAEVDRETKDVLIPMPEGSYKATSRLFISIWERPLWPFWPLTRKMYRAELQVPSGIPVEGKGENSWDCGENHTYGLTCAAVTHEEGISRLVENMLRSRKRYGGGYQHRDLKPVLAESGAPALSPGEKGGE